MPPPPDYPEEKVAEAVLHLACIIYGWPGFAKFLNDAPCSSANTRVNF
jgi:hypothetical protein